MNDSKQIKMHWRNFILILIGILLIGIIIGLFITPIQKEEAEKSACFRSSNLILAYFHQ
jgi:large-conductance mechanosensitive channel